MLSCLRFFFFALIVSCCVFALSRIPHTITHFCVCSLFLFVFCTFCLSIIVICICLESSLSLALVITTMSVLIGLCIALRVGLRVYKDIRNGNRLSRVFRPLWALLGAICGLAYSLWIVGLNNSLNNKNNTLITEGTLRFRFFFFF